jgi:hypothetical protein
MRGYLKSRNQTISHSSCGFTLAISSYSLGKKKLPFLASEQQFGFHDGSPL